MTTIINASNGATSGLITTADASGILQLQTNNGTPALTLNTTQALGVGTSPSYGTAGQALISQGSGAAPIWGSAGAMTLISTKSISSATSFNFTGLSGYNYYQLIFTASSLSANDYFVLQFGYGSTPTYITSGYGCGISRPNSATSQANLINSAVSYITLQYPSTVAGPITSNLFINTALSTSPSYITVNGITQTSNAYVAMVEGNLQPSSTITALQVYMLYGATFSGTASLYGISS